MNKSEESDLSKVYMPESKRLGKDKDGNVFVADWKREMLLTAYGAFGDIAECLESDQPPDWMDWRKRYQHQVPKYYRSELRYK